MVIFEITDTEILLNKEVLKGPRGMRHFQFCQF